MTSKFRIPLSEPSLDGRELRYLKEAIASTWVSSGGPHVQKFEQLVGKRLGVHAVSTMNGTAALHIALLIAGVKPGDEVIVPALTFVATANAVTYCGARPVVIDVDEESWCLDPVQVEKYLAKNKKSKRRVSAIVPVHVLGHPANMDALIKISRRYRVPIVEDACEALGAFYKNRVVGRLGDVACLSFNGNKVITSGGGGMVITKNKRWAERARYLVNQAKDSPDEYIHSEVGFNYRMTNLQAAVGLAQMEQLDKFLQKKKQIARRYREAFAQHPNIECLPEASWARPTHWLFTIRLRGRGANSSINFVKHLRAMGIEARRLWRPMHMLPMYHTATRLPVSEKLYEDCVSLPSSVGLSLVDQNTVIRACLKLL